MPWWGRLLIVVLGLPCVCGVFSAISVPAWMLYLRRAKTAEAVATLLQLCSATGAYAADHNALPPSAPVTPLQVPAGTRAVDAPDTWSHPTWQALGFNLRDPHRDSYEFVSAGSAFTVRAYGDSPSQGEIPCGRNPRSASGPRRARVAGCGVNP